MRDGLIRAYCRTLLITGTAANFTFPTFRFTIAHHRK